METKTEKQMIKRSLWTAVLLAMTLSLTAFAGEGSDTGNGTGDGAMPAMMHYPPMPAAQWCNAVQGMLEDTLQWSSMASNPAMSRRYLVSSVQGILASYQAGGLPYQPLTYSLLANTLEVNLVFPATMMGDQAATIVLFHLVDTARKVNQQFDLAHFVPMVNEYHHCGKMHCGGGFGQPWGPMHIDFISSARTLLEMFFSPALPNSYRRDTVLDALAYDMWELKVVSLALGWIIQDLQSDIFGRSLACLSSRLNMVKMRLDNYLGGMAPVPFDDRLMVQYARNSLRDSLDILERYASGGCRY